MNRHDTIEIRPDDSDPVAALMLGLGVVLFLAGVGAAVVIRAIVGWVI